MPLESQERGISVLAEKVPWVVGLGVEWLGLITWIGAVQSLITLDGASRWMPGRLGKSQVQLEVIPGTAQEAGEIGQWLQLILPQGGLWIQAVWVKTEMMSG